MALTPKQQRFVEHYAGNATQAAVMAGYSKKTAYRIGAELLQKTSVSEAIKAREATESRARIASRQQRQEFWTETMVDSGAEMKDRLKASELLGKSEGDFLDRVDLGGGLEINITIQGFDD
jgi:phage terminase small subunit